ncbi:Cell wall protein ecm33 [Schizosaccharomyces pombe]|uniref:Cell wall protein ecm33 n=1 Tax=Schizosaccharomyces pombe (strain 972 / ATCC 24843) TaxID=284812 RepID=ECM33_SCHPO|nr:cell wall protein Ecm33 [Schizosaccharomyces pombe]O13960.2 RecName: Full=Cell wall protein ecm33; Flags: Precursor [Schizosaccharomyces pombe 972h-]CAB86946.2 cell wall protein Ecm33 [Schizosaccharomyces pombe]|eukprot:NP_001342953.1 cell wall protein Ecm33 [Schizosaccharomyces pombe]
MLFKSFALTLLFAAARVQAASNCSSGPYNISAQGTLDELNSCTVLNGDLYISDAGNSGITTLTVNGIESVQGDVVVSDGQYLTSLSFPSLKNVSGAFNVNNMIRMNNLATPELTSVGSLNLAVLPNLQELQFNAGLSDSDSVVIDDTQLQAIDGISLDSVTTFQVTNNRYIQEITMEGLESAQNIQISANSKGVSVNFSKLSNVTTATFDGISNVFIGNLKSAAGNLYFSNTTLDNISVPYLTEIGQSFAVLYSPELTSLNFPNLTTVGGGFVINDTGLTSIDGFPVISEIGGGLVLLGNFSSIDMPDLSDVKGALTVETKATNFTCPWSNDDSVIKGDDFTCQGSVATISATSSYDLSSTVSATSGSATSATGSATTTSYSSDSSASSSSSSSHESSAASNGFTAGALVLGSLLVAALAM